MSLSLWKLGISVAGVALAGWIGYRVVSTFYLKPVAAANDEISKLRTSTAAWNKELDKWPAARDELKRFGSTLLSQEADQTDHRLRTLLTEIGMRQGLAGVQVSTSAPKAVRTPLAKTVRGRVYSRLTDAVDFAVVRGSFQGVGSLEEVMVTLAYLQSQPWLHEIEHVSIEPRGRQTVEFELDVGFAVAFAPDLCPKDAPMPAITEPSAEALAEAGQIAARDVFEVPVTPEPVPEVKPSPPKPPAPPPYDRWKLTGLIERRSAGATIASEAWFVNIDSGEQRVLKPGEALLDFEFESVAGECAVFRFEGQRVAIHQGQTLAEHGAPDSVDCPGADGDVVGTRIQDG